MKKWYLILRIQIGFYKKLFETAAAISSWAGRRTVTLLNKGIEQKRNQAFKLAMREKE